MVRIEVMLYAATARQVVEPVREALNSSAYTLRTCDDLEDCLSFLRAGGLDAILLAIDDPGEALAAVRQVSALSPKPILLLQGPKGYCDALDLMERGAHDFVCGDLEDDDRSVLRELRIRLDASLRLALGGQGASEEGRLVVADITIDTVRRRVFKGSHEVALSRLEYKLLVLLAARPGHIVTHEELLRSVWSANQAHRRDYLRTYIARLRRKLGWKASASTEPSIGAVRGRGYRLLLPSG